MNLDRFGSHLAPPNPSKTLKNLKFFKVFDFWANDLLHDLSDTILTSTWPQLGAKNRSKIIKKTDQKKKHFL